MKRRGFIRLVMVGLFLVGAVSCSTESRVSRQGDKPFGASGIPPQLRSRSNAGGVPVTPGGNTGQAANPPQFTPEEEIVFTDPDATDADSPELSEILRKSEKRDGWELSETVAKKRAAREGKPVLVWFTDSKVSPMCKALSQELFSTPDFEKWAMEHVIRLRVDANQSLDDEALSLDQRETMRVDVRRYVSELKKRYRVMGSPSLFMLNPSGEIIGRYRGYKRGQAEFLWGQLKHALEVSNRVHEERKQSLASKGYRDWTGRDGRKVFARLIRYRDGNLQLVEPDGTLCETRVGKLSDEDQAWIEARKHERGGGR